jgi:hypothetical protein
MGKIALPAVPSLIWVLQHDANAKVRWSAVRAVVNIPIPPEELVHILSEELNDSSPPEPVMNLSGVETP